MTKASARPRRTASALVALALRAQSSARAGCGCRRPPDSWRDKGYWLAETGITKAWEVSKGANVKVAVIDSGVDGTHPDLPGCCHRGTQNRRRRPGTGEEHRAKPEHGTLVATMLAGRGHQPPPPPRQPSPTPARLVPLSARTGLSGSRPRLNCSPFPAGSDPPTPAAISTRADCRGGPLGRRQRRPGHQHLAGQHLPGVAAELGRGLPLRRAEGRRDRGRRRQPAGREHQVGAPATIPGVLTVAGLDRKGAASIDSSSQGSASASRRPPRTWSAACPRAATPSGRAPPAPPPSSPASRP